MFKTLQENKIMEGSLVLRGVMNEDLKVVIRVECERDIFNDNNDEFFID